MGRANLEGMLEMANDSSVAFPNKDSILSWHLRSNHYPPVPLSMLPVCKEAIDKANDGLWDEMVDLPKGITWRDNDYAPVREIIEAHHLDAFLRRIDDDD